MKTDTLFDKVCKVADSGKSHEVTSLVKGAKLFLFDADAAGLTMDTMNDLASKAEEIQLIMPFDLCAVEVRDANKGFYNLLMFIGEREEHTLHTLTHMDCMIFEPAAKVGNADYIFHFKIQCFEVPDFAGMFDAIANTGTTKTPRTKNTYKVLDEFTTYSISDSGVALIPGNLKDSGFATLNAHMQDVTDAVNMWFRLFLVCLSTPKNFILEETPKGFEKVSAKNKKALRVHQRPLYTILRPLEIRKKLGLTAPDAAEHRGPGGRKSPAPHERRRHKRRLRVESGYKEDREIIIEATWIGASEAVVGNKRYKVRLDV